MRVGATGNRIAALHIAGIAASIHEKRPPLSPFQVNTVLRTTASDVSPAGVEHAPNRD